MKAILVMIALCGGVPAIAAAAPPQVVKTVPENHAQNVDPALSEIRVTFDQDMSPGGYSWVGGGPTFPKPRGRPRWVDARTCVLAVDLESDHEYWLSINSNRFTNFRSATGEPAAPYPIRFKTASGGTGAGKHAEASKHEPPAKGAAQATAAADDLDPAGEPLQFVLEDVYQRQVRSEDYRGVPVVIMCGACWCGGCQQDARPFGDLAAKYGARGVQFIRSVSGENELTALEFQLHYRLPVMCLLDVNRRFERRYNRDGWTFVMLVDRDGKVVYRANNPDMSQLGPWIERLAGGATEVQPVVRGGVPYMRTTLERSGETGQARPIERFPSLAVDRDGRAYVAFTRQRDANSDVCVRAYDGHTWSADRDVAATDDCEYDATVIVDRNNRAWMSWTGSSDGQHFTVFVAPLSVSGEPGKPMQVTQADDDAMHARMACDRAGDLWITYYKWSKMGPYSRDKEVYARRYKGNAWSDEIHVSPEDVPVYEDHSDPAITSYLDGVLVGWSWDFHKPTGYTQEAEAPTIFVREVSADLTLGRAQDVSGATIDTVPTVAVDGKNGVWCAWDSLDWDSQARAHHKRLLVCRRDLSVLRTPAPHAITDAVTNVCTPTLVAAPEGRLTLVWSEQATAGGPWTLKRADFDERTSQWSRPQVLESKSDPRFPSAAYAPGGQLWVAYACQTEKGRELVVKKPGG